jgi:translocation and assembly module TamB
MSASPTETKTSAPVTRQAQPSRLHKWIRMLPFIAPLVLLLVAPIIVAKSNLRNQMVGWFVSDFPGKVTIGHAGLSWFAPVELRDLSVVDSEGKVAVTIKRISFDCTLWQLASGRYENAVIQVQTPTADWHIRSDGSNLEELIQPFLNSASSSSGSPPLKIEIEDGRLTLTHTETGSRSQIRKITCTVETSSDCPFANVDAIGRWTAVAEPDGISPGGAITVSLRPSGGDTTAAPADAPRLAEWHIETHQLAVGYLEPLLQRFYPRARLSGLINVDVNFDRPVDSAQCSCQVFGHIDCRNFAADIPEIFHGDRLFFDAIDFDGRVDVAGSMVSFDNFNVDSSILKIAANGDARLPDPLVEDPKSTTADRELEIVAALDLPSVAAMLPQTLHLHSDLRVDAGRLLAQIGTRSTGETRHWMARLKVTQISGRQRDRTIQWEEPIAFELAARQTADTFTIERLVCDSAFMKLTGRGDSSHAEFSGECNLDVLIQNVSQFADLGDRKIAGRMELQGAWDRLEDQQSKFSATATVDDFILESRNRQPWREKHLVVALNGQGLASLSRIDRINEFEFRLRSGTDSLTVALAEPTTLTEQTRIPARVQLAGDLNSWAARSTPFIDWSDWRASGAITIDGRVELSANRWIVKDSQLIVDNLAITNGDVVIQDDHLDARLAGDVDHVARQGSAYGTLVGNNVSARISSLQFSFGDQPGVTGTFEVNARLQSALRLKNGIRIVGQLDSKAELSNTGSESQFSVLGTVQGLQLTRPVNGRTRIAAAQTVVAPMQWVEPKFRFAAQGHYAEDQLRLDGLSLNTSGMRITGQGTASQGSHGIETDFSGEIHYDMAVISDALATVFGSEIRVTGEGSQPFQIHGPLSSPGSLGTVSPELAGSFGFDWQTADVHRIRFGEGRIEGTLRKQILRFAPISVTLADAGQLTIRPIITLDTQQPVLHLNGQTSLLNATITPEIANNWIGYVAPMLANTADIEGRFSAQISRAAIVLSDATAGDVAGQLRIEHADARPGPIALQLIQIVRSVRSLLDRSRSDESYTNKSVVHMNRQAVDFRLKDRRVYHRGLVFEIDGVPVETSGSVGLNQSLAITAQIPIRKEWVENDRILSRMANRKLSIPIRGFVNRPQLDSRVIADLARQIGQSATQSLIEDQLGDKLDDLLGRPGR